MERRVIETIQWKRIIGRPWLIRANEGIGPGHQDYTPTLYKKCHGNTESQDHPKDGSVFETYKQIITHTHISKHKHWGKIKTRYLSVVNHWHSWLALADWRQKVMYAAADWLHTGCDSAGLRSTGHAQFHQHWIPAETGNDAPGVVASSQ